MLPNIDLGQIGLDCLNFLPELLACGGIVLFLLLRLFDRSHMGSIALLVTVLALGVSVAQWSYLGSPQSGGGGFHGILRPTFGGLLVYDHLTIFLRCFLYGFTAFIIWLSLTTGIPDREDSADFYCLLLGATIGMVVMASATHLLMVYIGIEMASLPSYALAGYLKGRRQSSEAALKYVVYGGGAAGVMLYGISLLAGRFGTAYLPDIAAGLVSVLSPAGGGMVFDPVLILAILFILIGVAFKLAAVPFHFWCPDVFEGAAAEVAGYLSVASKGAALALLARLVLILCGVDSIVQPVVERPLGSDRPLPDSEPGLLRRSYGDVRQPGRLFADQPQTAAGLLDHRPCRLHDDGTDRAQTDRRKGQPVRVPVGLQAVLFYLIAYLFMNLGAFAVVAYLRNQTGSEDLDDYRGMVRRSPWMVVTLSIFLLSLLGMPPLVGFTAKFQIFAALWDASQGWYARGEEGMGAMLFGLLIIGGVNSVLSAVYYIKVMKVMILEGRAEDLEGREPVRLPEPLSAVAFSTLIALVVLVLGILWGPLDRYSREGADRFAAKMESDPRSRTSGGGGGPPGMGRPPGVGGPQRGPQGQRPGGPGAGKGNRP
jgi:NADH-quinone oxidoreductase subunit N